MQIDLLVEQGGRHRALGALSQLVEPRLNLGGLGSQCLVFGSTTLDSGAIDLGDDGAGRPFREQRAVTIPA